MLLLGVVVPYLHTDELAFWSMTLIIAPICEALLHKAVSVTSPPTRSPRSQEMKKEMLVVLQMKMCNKKASSTWTYIIVHNDNHPLTLHSVFRIRKTLIKKVEFVQRCRIDAGRDGVVLGAAPPFLFLAGVDILRGDGMRAEEDRTGGNVLEVCSS